jgi:RNA polymerase sigma-70 factor (ECF subfamily)
VWVEEKTVHTELFQKIYSEYSQKMYSYILWLTRNKAACEDILQTVFLKIWKNNGGPADSVERTRWIYAVARNACLDFFRSYNRYFRFRLKYAREAVTECRDEHMGHVWELLLDLAETDRSILYLHIKMGYPYEEIAHMLSMHTNQVRTRAFRALKQMRLAAERKGL